MKALIAVVATVLLAALATGYTLHARSRSAVAVAVEQGAVSLSAPGLLVFRDESSGKVASVPLSSPGGPRRLSSLSCQRFYAAAGTGLCLADAPGPLPTSVAITVDSALAERSRVEVAGVPNRARLSADGRMASWTTFVTGDSYSQPGTFSTRTAIRDVVADQLSSNIEDLAGMGRAEDLNYWGVTFAADNRTFYATVSTGGKTHLVRGDNSTWTVSPLRENAECPSLSPDGTRLAYKKRVARDGVRPWREYVLDLATMTETLLAETRGIDDQVAWLDDRTIAYGLVGEGIWKVPADGSGKPELMVLSGSSPSVVRG